MERNRSPLDEVLRQGALQMLVNAIEAEVAAYIETHQHEVGEHDRRLVVRNGHARERTIVSGAGQLKIQAPRVDDRRIDEQGRRCRFTSQILPPYLRRTKSVEELIPWLYRKGISTGDFSEALEALLGPDAPACRRRRWCGSKKSGDANTRPGPSATSAASGLFTLGPTASTPTSVWTMNGSVYWS